MFQKFSESARRSLFHAAHVAVTDRSDRIGTIHLLAGIRRQSPRFFKNLNLGKAGVKLAVFSHKSARKVAGSFHIPLGERTKRAMLSAVEAAERFGSETVAPVHLLWGILHVDGQLRKRLWKAGLTETHMKSLLERQRKATPKKDKTARSGIGYDLHRLTDGRKLILGGVVVPFEKGPVGHSDGDVLSHAICDALLGAAGLGDIGTHFPDTDAKWKGASSLVFLERVRDLIAERGLRIVHIDAVVIMEKPKLGPHFPPMREVLARSLGIEPAKVNLKAKTNEGIGEIGRGEAIAAQAIATLEG